MDYGLSTCMCLGMPIQEALILLSEHGITAVEYAALNLIMSSTDERLRHEYFSTRDASRLKEKSLPIESIRESASSLGVSPVQIHSPDYDLASSDDNRRMLAVEKTSEMLNICSDLGATCLIVHLGSAQSTMLVQDGVEGAKERTIEAVGILARRASDLGVKIALENTWQDIYGSRAEHLLEVVESTDPDHICACLDTGHSQRLGVSPADAVRKMGSHLGATHIHDSVGSLDHLPPFVGDIDWQDFSSSLREVRYRNMLMGEIEGSYDMLTVTNRILLSRLAMDRLLNFLDAGEESLS